MSILDQTIRETAWRSYDRNVVVLASAGTGKTSLLVERLLNQIVETGLSLRRTAAITFTEKAAAEMLERLQRGLNELARPGGPQSDDGEAMRVGPHLRERLGEEAVTARAGAALDELPLASISTIHAFCARLLRQYGTPLGIPPDFRVDEGFGYEDLKRDGWQRFVDGPDGPEGPRRELWIGALETLDLRELREIAFRLASFQLRDLSHDVNLSSAGLVLAQRVQERIRCVNEALAQGPSPKDPLGSYLSSAGAALRAFLDGGQKALHQAADTQPYVTAKGLARSVLGEGGPPQSQRFPDATELAGHVSRDLRALARVNDEAVSGAVELVLPFALGIRERTLREGRLPFDAVLSLTRSLLLRHPELRREIGRQHHLILVDEFQDTDPLQYEIVFLLAEREDGPPAADAFEARLSPGKLFIVGDPKQSIYGFRGADIVACQRAIAHVEASGGQKLELITTWRAFDELVRPLNRLFERVFVRAPGEDPDLHPPYGRLESGRGPGGARAGIEVWGIDPVGGANRDAEDSRRDEAQAVAAWIARECGPESSSGRRLEHVAILLRAFTQVHLYTQALRAHGIPFELDRSRTLFDQPEVQQLWAVLRAVARPTDAPAVLGVLRSSLGAVADAELARYATEGDEGWCYMEIEPDPALFPEVARAFAWLRSLHSRAHRVALDRLMVEILEEGGLLPIQASVFEGRARVATLRAVIDKVARLARDEPGWPLGRVLRAFEARVLEGTSGEGAPGAAEAVQLLTFHGAKGLEFPVVFVVDLARARDDHQGASAREIRVGSWDEGALWVRTPALQSANAILAAEEEERREEAETRRLFYVACTRAKERLILVHAPRGAVGQKAWIRFLEPWGYPAKGLGDKVELESEVEVLHRRVQLGPTEPVRRAPPRGSNWGEAVRRAERAAERAAQASGVPFQQPSGVREEADAARERADEGFAAVHRRGASARARAVGLAVHEILERCDFAHPDRSRALVGSASLNAARSVGADPESVEAETRRILEGLLKSQVLAELGAREIIGREIPFLLEEQGERWSGTVDLVYRGPEGRLVVADYKTDREPPALPPEAYERQLSVYARAIARAHPDEPEPERELIYVRTGLRQRL